MTLQCIVEWWQDENLTYHNGGTVCPALRWFLFAMGACWEVIPTIKDKIKAKKLQKKYRKTLDKSKGLWYNKGTKLRNGGLTNGKSKMV